MCDCNMHYMCSECYEKIINKRRSMPNIKITAEVNGKQVPLENISIETFEAIKALEKPKKIPVPVARLTVDNNDSPCCLLFRPTCDLNLGAGWIHCLDLKRGTSELYWGPGHDKEWIKHLFKSVRPL